MIVVGKHNCSSYRFWPPPPPRPCVDMSTYSNALELLICLSVSPTRRQVASAGPVP